MGERSSHKTFNLVIAGSNPAGDTNIMKHAYENYLTDHDVEKCKCSACMEGKRFFDLINRLDRLIELMESVPVIMEVVDRNKLIKKLGLDGE